MNDRCTLLLNSYDGGEDCWHTFFTALKTQWPQMDLPIVLNTESKIYEFEGYNIQTFALYKNGKKVPWATRLIETLKRIKTDYILFFLEDNWLNKPVDDDFFRKSIEYMDSATDIASIEYRPYEEEGYPNIKDGVFPDLELRPKKCPYKLNCQVAIWRRKTLMSFLRPHENPWEWEDWGSIRAERYPDRFYVLKEGMKWTFPYAMFEYPNTDLPKDGVISRGKWDKEMIEGYKELYDLSDIDFSIRGYEDWDEWCKIMSMTFVDKLKEPHLIKRACHRLFVYPYRRWLSLR